MNVPPRPINPPIKGKDGTVSRKSDNLPPVKMRTFRNDAEDILNAKAPARKSFMDTYRGKTKNTSTEISTATESHLGWALFIVIVLFAFLLGIAFYVIIGKDGILNSIGMNKLEIVETQVVPQNSETLSGAEVIISGVPKSQIIADISILFGKTTLMKGSSRRLHFSVSEGALGRDATSQEFITSITNKTADSLIRSLEQNFESGIYATTELSSYFVFTSRSYPNTFAGMLKWEETLPEDMLSVVLPWSSTGNQDTARRMYFEDSRLQNYNVRVAKSPEGKVLLIYGFPSKEKLIICGNEEVFLALASKLSEK